MRSSPSSIRRHQRVFASLLAGASLIAVGGTVAAAYSEPSIQQHSPTLHSSTNQAATWTLPSNEIDAPAVPTPGGAQVGAGSFNAVSCATANDCVAVGGDGNLQGVAATSSNGGDTWTAATVENGQPELNAVSCESSKHCVAVGVGGGATSSDGGNTWTSVSIPTGQTTLLGVSCASVSICVSVGVTPVDAGPYGGEILVTSDGGSTWTTPQLPAHVGALGSVNCPTTNLCVAVGAEILVSTDAGRSWTPEFVNGGTGVLRNVSCSSVTECTAIGPNGIGVGDATAAAIAVVTSDGGTSWSPITMPPGSFTLNTIECASDRSCVASGPANRQTAPLWVSTDGGSTWASQTLPSGVTAVASLSCQSSSDCVYVGVEGSTPVTGSTTNGSKWIAAPVTTNGSTTSGVSQ